MSTSKRTRVAVYLSLGVALFETGGVAAAAVVTGSSAVLAQTFANVADLGVQVFLVIAVVTSARAADASHPLGYGRERFFWSLFAAIGVFTGGCVAAFEEAIRSGLHQPSRSRPERSGATPAPAVSRPARTCSARPSPQPQRSCSETESESSARSSQSPPWRSHKQPATRSQRLSRAA